jgi:hypothetical protein
MPDRMSNIVLFETEEEVKAYKSVLGEGYKINVEAYVRYLQEKFPNLEKYSIENQSRVIVIKALTTAWAFTGMQWTIDLMYIFILQFVQYRFKHRICFIFNGNLSGRCL